MTFEASGVEVRVKRRWLYALSLAFGYTGIAISSERILANDVRAFFLVDLMALVAMTAFGVAWTLAPRRRLGKLSADTVGLNVAGELLFRKSDIRRVRVRHARGETFVRFVGRRGLTVDVVVADDTQADTLLAAMRFDDESVVEPFRLGVGPGLPNAIKVVALVVGTFVLTMALLPLLAWSVSITIACEAAILLAYAFLLFRQVVHAGVGADGVRLHHWLGRRRFLSYGVIARVDRDGTDITLHLKDGASCVVSAGTRWTSKLFGVEEEARAFADRIATRVARYNDREVNFSPPMLTRAGRKTDVWLEALRNVGETHSLFRDQALPNDVLWRIVKNPHAAPGERAGAAVALVTSGDGTLHDRLVRVAEACADSELRTALAAIAKADEHALRRALDRIGDVAEMPPGVDETTDTERRMLDSRG